LEAKISLFNTSKQFASFKVKITCRERYSVKPWIGILEGEGEGEVSVTYREPFPEENAEAERWLEKQSKKMLEDGVMICWLSACQKPAHEEQLLQLWKNTPTTSVRCHVLQCRIEKAIAYPTRVGPKQSPNPVNSSAKREDFTESKTKGRGGSQINIAKEKDFAAADNNDSNNQISRGKNDDNDAERRGEAGNLIPEAGDGFGSPNSSSSSKHFSDHQCRKDGEPDAMETKRLTSTPTYTGSLGKSASYTILYDECWNDDHNNDDNNNNNDDKYHNNKSGKTKEEYFAKDRHHDSYHSGNYGRYGKRWNQSRRWNAGERGDEGREREESRMHENWENGKQEDFEAAEPRRRFVVDGEGETRYGEGKGRQFLVDGEKYGREMEKAGLGPSARYRRVTRLVFNGVIMAAILYVLWQGAARIHKCLVEEDVPKGLLDRLTRFIGLYRPESDPLCEGLNAWTSWIAVSLSDFGMWMQSFAELLALD